MTDATNQQSEKSRLGYSEQLPAKGCWNCACYNEPARTCSRLYAESTVNAPAAPQPKGRSGMFMAWCEDSGFSVTKCGVCRMWVSHAVADAYKHASSFEEAKLRAAVLADGSYVSELDNVFAERKATPKMEEYAAKILGSPEMAGRLTPFPLEPSFQSPAGSDESPCIEFVPTKSFWLVRAWLSENAPKYEELERSRRRTYADDCNQILKEFIKREIAAGKGWLKTAGPAGCSGAEQGGIDEDLLKALLGEMHI